MARKKGDINIGLRASSEVLRLTESTKHACYVIGCSREVLRAWRNGIAPSACYLVRLHEIGADVLWILTGKESKK